MATMIRVSQVVLETYWEYKILIPICVSVSSLDRSEDLEKDQSKERWPRLDWLLKLIDKHIYVFIYMLLFDCYFPYSKLLVELFM